MNNLKHRTQVAFTLFTTLIFAIILFFSIVLITNKGMAQSCGQTNCGNPPVLNNNPYFESNICQGTGFNFNDAGRYLSPSGYQQVALGQSYIMARVQKCNINGCSYWIPADLYNLGSPYYSKINFVINKLFYSNTSPYFANGVEFKYDSPFGTELICNQNGNSKIETPFPVVARNSSYGIETKFSRLSLTGSMKSHCSWYKDTAVTDLQPDGTWTKAEVVYYSVY